MFRGSSCSKVGWLKRRVRRSLFSRELRNGTPLRRKEQAAKRRARHLLELENDLFFSAHCAGCSCETRMNHQGHQRQCSSQAHCLVKLYASCVVLGVSFEIIIGAIFIAGARLGAVSRRLLRFRALYWVVQLMPRA